MASILVEKIENGTVIDHIEAGRGLRVLQILGIAEGAPSGRVALMVNVPSKKMGRKDILKIEGFFADSKSANKIALACPRARLNIIKKGKVVQKIDVRLPEGMEGIARCPNPQCITNSEPSTTTYFAREGGMLRCGFCERLFDAPELV